MCMKQILAAFTTAQLQTFRNILLVLRSNEKTIQDALDYVELITRPGCEKAITKLCPECSSPMKLFQVNISKATQVGGGYKSQWQCLMCEHDIFSRLTAREEILKARRIENGTR